LAISSVKQIAVSGNMLKSEPSRFIKEVKEQHGFEVIEGDEEELPLFDY
jgi:hypothetical protein